MGVIKGIKNLLFDQGGVIVDIERDRCLEELRKLGMEMPELLIGLYKQEGPFFALENGDISVAEFHNELRPLMPEGVTEEQMDRAFSSFIVGIPLHRLQALRELRKRYRTYILSNTNPLMFEGVIAQSFAQEGLDVNAYFDGVTVSYKAHSNKPDRKIFDYAIATMGIVPEETLFFDDGQENLDAAARLGFKTALVEPGCEFMDIITKMEEQ
ncbi:MAG: HAD family phosphatase [Muribaculaceae bacterium]|nr:HAD family phosphatase [Muribaculaceae bacterium]MBR6489909.1 HAD family phosphatase [Muribaculaceae bacterium]